LRTAIDLRVELLAEDARRAQAAGEAAAGRRLALEALRAASAIDLAGTLVARDPRGESTGAAALFEQLAARRHRLEALGERGTPPDATTRTLEREVALLRTRLALADYGDGAPSGALAPGPAMAAGPAPPPAIPEGTAVLVYSLGEARGWRWTLTASGIALDPLPARATIDAAVDRLLRRVREARGTAPARELEALATLLLPAPAMLAGARRWRIVADGPVGALPWPLLAQRGSAEGVSLLPGAAALFEQPGVTRTVLRPGAPRPPLRLALFGDPVFGADDPRIARPADRRDPTTRGGRSIRSGGTARGLALEPEPRALPRLPGTGREVESLARLASGAGATVSLQATGLQATRAAVLQLPAAGLDVLHFATHAIIDPEVPELASLVLSRVDGTGAPQPGNLRARDILRDGRAPPLVVLSACDAAAEPAATADGRMTLVRAFLGAGAREVVASLWEVPDASTAELMGAFYEGLLRERLDAETALARAQARLAAGGRWSAPFYWSGFVLTRAAP
jgi:hypothetical protein